MTFSPYAFVSVQAMLVMNMDGGVPNSEYLMSQNADGGNPSSTYTQDIDGGTP